MAYVYDENLEFLGECNEEQLAKLAEILIKDDDAKFRRFEEVTGSNEYKRYGNHYHKYWEILAGDFQKFGGNSGANLLRGGKGVQYNEILTDILGANFSEKTVIEKEKELLKRSIPIILDEIGVKERISIAKSIEFQGKDYNTDTITDFINKENNDKDFDYKITNIILEYITTRRMDYSLVKKMFSFINENTLLGIKAITTSIIPGTIFNTLNLPLMEAKRVTIPASVVIACLRKILNYKKEQ